MQIIINQYKTFTDERGEIKTILSNMKFSSVLKIVTEKGFKRANHYHVDDKHFTYLICGKLRYIQRPLGSYEKPSEYILLPGQSIYTPNVYEHQFIALERSIMDCYCYLNRDQESYESDTVRLNFDLSEVLDNWKN